MTLQQIIQKITFWPNALPSPQTDGERTRIGVWTLVALLSNDFQNSSAAGAFNKTQLERGEAITAGMVTDTIAMDDFAGCIVDAIMGKNGGGQYVDITQQAGYVVNGVNNIDGFMLSPNYLAAHNDSRFNPNYALTGVGTTVGWPTGTYSDVYVLYTSPVGVSQLPTMLKFTTNANQSVYNLGSLTGFKPAYLVYGASNLQYSGGSGAPALGQFSVNTTTGDVTINPGGAIPANVHCILVSL